jgi:hypothetical protein
MELIQTIIQWEPEGFSRGKSGRDVKFTTHHHSVQRLRMSGAIPLLPLHAFMMWTDTILLL